MAQMDPPPPMLPPLTPPTMAAVAHDGPSVGTAFIDIVPRLAGVVVPVQPKPGMQTTEFWVSAAGSLSLIGVGLWLFLVHRIDQGAFVTIESIGGGGVPGVYAVLRTILKAAAPSIPLPDPTTPTT